MMSLFRVFVLTLALAAAGLSTPAAFAQLSIDITKGNIDPTPIAVPDFMSTDARGQQIGRDLAEVVRADLERSGLFRALDPNSFIEKQTNIDYAPTFADWRVIKSEALVSGRIVMESDSRMRVEFRLWDIFGGEQLSGLRLAATPDNWRRMAHKVSDAIYSQLTGESGYFDSRIVFIDESGPKTDRKKRLAIMDQDGANPQFLLTGRAMRPTANKSSSTAIAAALRRFIPWLLMAVMQNGSALVKGVTMPPSGHRAGTKLLLSKAQAGNSILE